MASYSRVTIARAPTSKTQASTHGFLEPITNTLPLIIPGVCLKPSRNEFVSFRPYVPSSIPYLANCIILLTVSTVHTGIDCFCPRNYSLKYNFPVRIRSPIEHTSTSSVSIYLGATDWPCPRSI